MYRKQLGQETDILICGKPKELIEKDLGNGISRFGGSMRHPSYEYAYLKSARVLLDNALTNKQLDEFGLPIFYMVRHTVELKIKGLLGMAYDIFKMKHDLFRNKITQENIPSNRKLDRLKRKHDISHLYTDLLGSCSKLNIDIPKLLFQTVVDEINRYELTSTWSRYNKSKQGSHVADEVELPIVKLVEDLELLFNTVSYNTERSLESELYSEFNHLMSCIEDEKC